MYINTIYCIKLKKKTKANQSANINYLQRLFYCQMYISRLKILKKGIKQRAARVISRVRWRLRLRLRSA